MSAQNGSNFSFPNNYAINNQNMNFNQNFMNQNMMMGNQNMMMGNSNMMMGNQNMMMGNQYMMMGNPNMMMGNQNMMMGNQNCFNNQNNSMGFNNMNVINTNNTNINSNTNNDKNETSTKDEINIHDKEEILPRKLEIKNDIKKEEDTIGIIFELSTGPEIHMYGTKKTIFKEMVRKLCQKINLDERYMENRIKMISNGTLLSIDSYSTLEDLRFRYMNKINIYDDDNAIGT